MAIPVRSTPAPHPAVRDGGGMRLGLALGGGAARGWAHIGVLEVLASHGITPAVVCGCSMGALVGAGYVVGRLDALAEWARSLTWRGVLGLLDPGLSGGGLIRGERLLRFLREHYIDIDIEAAPIAFGAVATDLATGREVWLRSGPLFSAVHASIAVPGVVGPVRQNGRWLVDGGLVNPVPVSLCRAMGADFVIAVNVNSEAPPLAPPPRNGANGWVLPHDWSTYLKTLFGGAPKADSSAEPPLDPFGQPSVLGAVSSALYIMQDYIARSRLAGEPPHLTLAPRLGHIGVHEFDRAAEAIAEGRRCAEAMLPVLGDALAAHAARRGTVAVPAEPT